MAIEPDPMNHSAEVGNIRMPETTNPPSGRVKLQDMTQEEIDAAVDRIRTAGKATDPAGTEAALEHDVDAVLDRLEAGIAIERKALDAVLERLTRRAAA